MGSTTAVTDASGNVKYSYTYSPYGELLSGTYGQVLFLYNGQYGVTSDNNGLYYMRARYYNIAIKRFCNQDILTGEIGESKSLNRYAYVEGNPVSYVDPFGLSKVDTSELHNNIAKASLLLSGAVLAILATGISMPLALTTAGFVGLGLNIANGIAYSYDLKHAKTEEEKMNAKIGILSVGVSYSVSHIPGGNYFFSNFSDELVSAVSDFVWNIFSYSSGKLNEALNNYY